MSRVIQGQGRFTQHGLLRGISSVVRKGFKIATVMLSNIVGEKIGSTGATYCGFIHSNDFTETRTTF